jgi:hypothetical protein
MGLSAIKQTLYAFIVAVIIYRENNRKSNKTIFAAEDFQTVGGKNLQKKMSSFWAKMAEI